MIVPRFWSEAKVQEAWNGKMVTLRRFGWSDQSEEAAGELAQARALQAFEDFKQGGKVSRIEKKVSYNGADGVPIREEIISQHSDSVITRNLYGARCLNTPDVLFGDVDYAQGPGFWHFLFVAPALLALGAGAGWQFELKWKWVLMAGFLIAGFLTWPGMKILSAIQTILFGNQEKRVLRALQAFLERNPNWLVSAYRTPAGLRLLGLHALFDPAGPEAAGFFDCLGVDSLYRSMCQRQRCFRARVSAKPWRIGIQAHLKPRPGIWPIQEDLIPQRKLWVDGYESEAAKFAACEYVGDFGRGSVNAKAHAVKTLHDQLCQTGRNLPLA
ncbi:MAG: hypothetical protein EXR99_15395 [Gemmataceae bacterium]|nr:hypothetical protein [Gemmataceae bacterium]